MKATNSTNNNRILFVAPSVQAGWEKQSHITDFKLLSKLGSGSFGTVHEAKHKKTGKVYAIKEIKKSSLDSKKLLEHTRTEIKIMYSLNHPNIIKLYNHFEDDVSIFLVLQFAAKGQLYNLLRNQPDKKFVQPTASQYIRQITEGIKQIHLQKIMHRDLKLENILVDESNNMKIADFGWSHFVDPDKRNTYCGTLDYLAPEMIQKGHKHDERVDIWSIGVLAYELCTGCSPFSCSLVGDSLSVENIQKNIINANYKFPKYLSQLCQDFISKILKVKPEERLTLQQILNHPWLIKGDKKPQLKQQWLEKLKQQLIQMFPQDTVSNNEENSQFTKQQIYKYSRPDSIINLKSKRKKQQKLNESQMKLKNEEIKVMESKINEKSFDFKKMSQLELKVMQLEMQRKVDKGQIEKLREELIRAKQHKQCQQQIKRLMDQIIHQNKTLEQLSNKLRESENKFFQSEKRESKN